MTKRIKNKINKRGGYKKWSTSRYKTLVTKLEKKYDTAQNDIIYIVYSKKSFRNKKHIVKTSILRNCYLKSVSF